MEPRFNLFDSPTAAKIAKRFYNVSLALEESTLPKSLRELVELRVGQINGCGFCVDIHMKEGASAGESVLRLGLVSAWRHSTVFTEAEHFDDDEVGALVCLVSLINAATRMNVIVHKQGGDYEPGMFANLSN